ncbi:MAG: VOC family protein [Enterococcus sp.]
MTHGIGCCLWIDGKAPQIAAYYLDTFKETQPLKTTHFVDNQHGKAGEILTMTLELAGCEFMLLNGGDEFTPTPAISYLVDCETEAEVRHVWERLSHDGQILMPLSTEDIGSLFGWTIDQFGYSWQVRLSATPQKITPCIMFANDLVGQALAARQTWIQAFGGEATFEQLDDDDRVLMAGFNLRGQDFLIMESNYAHDFGFSLANSFYLYCQDQADIDQVWQAITQNGAEYPCGWMVDQYGLSWQTTTEELEDMTADGHEKQTLQMTLALYEMKKLDLEKLRQAFHSA